MMAPKVDLTRLQRDVNFIYAPLRLVLLNFAALDASFDRLKAAHRLQDFTQETITILLRVFAETMGEEWGRPQIPSALQATRQQLQQYLQQAGGHGQIIPNWLLGNKPIGVEMQEFLAVANDTDMEPCGFPTSSSPWSPLALNGFFKIGPRPRVRAKVKENRAEETAKASVNGAVTVAHSGSLRPIRPMAPSRTGRGHDALWTCWSAPALLCQSTFTQSLASSFYLLQLLPSPPVYTINKLDEP